MDDNNKSVNNFDFNSEKDKTLDNNVIKLVSLNERLNSFNITYENLEGFYSKIINKTNFYKTNLINFNSQVIKLLKV